MSITKIVVNLKRQKLFAYSGQQLIHEFDCVTGRSGKETDLGSHKIFLKEKDYVSRTYKVPMPYSMFFTRDRKAIHESSAGWVWLRSHAKVLGIEALGLPVGSHGCVGLTASDAKALFEETPLKTVVEVITGE